MKGKVIKYKDGFNYLRLEINLIGIKYLKIESYKPVIIHLKDDLEYAEIQCSFKRVLRLHNGYVIDSLSHNSGVEVTEMPLEFQDWFIISLLKTTYTPFTTTKHIGRCFMLDGFSGYIHKDSTDDYMYKPEIKGFSMSTLNRGIFTIRVGDTYNDKLITSIYVILENLEVISLSRAEDDCFILLNSKEYVYLPKL